MKSIHKLENKIFTNAMFYKNVMNVMTGIFYKNTEKLLFDYYSIGNIKFYKLIKPPLCNVRNSSYEFAVISKNKIPRDF